MRYNDNNSTIRYRSRGKIGFDVFVIARFKGEVKYHMGNDAELGDAGESQGGIYTQSVKQFDARYAQAR